MTKKTKTKTNEKILWCITDPCYLLSDEEWRKTHYGAHVHLLKKKTGRNAWMGETLYGDWGNHISGKGEIVDGRNSFCADAGMWCVCSPTEEMLKESEYEKYPHIAAFFKASENIKVEVDNSCRQWAVIRIYDDNELIFETDPYQHEHDCKYRIL